MATSITTHIYRQRVIQSPCRLYFNVVRVPASAKLAHITKYVDAIYKLADRKAKVC